MLALGANPGLEKGEDYDKMSLKYLKNHKIDGRRNQNAIDQFNIPRNGGIYVIRQK